MHFSWIARCGLAIGAGFVVALSGVAPRAAHAQGAPVPVEFQELYSELERSLDDFDALISSLWNGRKHPVTFGAELLSANSNVGPWLPTADEYVGVQLELDRLASLGVGAITLSVHFPILYEPFHEDRATYRQYLDFYTQLANDIRGRGMKLVVETQALFAFGAPLRPFYQSLTWAQYVRARADVAETIARQLRPDYLSVVTEPDTEAMLTGNAEANDPVASAAMVATMVERAHSVRGWSGQVGAGVGTWHFLYEAFATAYLRDAGVDYISAHVYPVVKDYLTRTLTLSDIADSYGKRVILGEAWLYKTGQAELVAPPLFKFDRDPFGFWAPLDEKFLNVMAKLAYTGRLELVSPFWSRYFFAYLDYNDVTRNLSGNELSVLVGMLAAQNMASGTVTTTGAAFRNAIAGGRR